MTKVLNPLMSSEASGSVGGLEFKRSRAGNVVGRKSTSTFQQSRATCDARAALGRARAAWTAQSAAARAAWERLATPHQTARNAFTAAYCRLAPAGLEASLAPHLAAHSPTPKKITAYCYSSGVPYYRISGTRTNDPFTRYLLYTAPGPAHGARPHDRKFAYLQHAGTHLSSFDVPMRLHPAVPWMRVKLVHLRTGAVLLDLALALQLGETRIIYPVPE